MHTIMYFIQNWPVVKPGEDCSHTQHRSHVLFVVLETAASHDQRAVPLHTQVKLKVVGLNSRSSSFEARSLSLLSKIETNLLNLSREPPTLLIASDTSCRTDLELTRIAVNAESVS